MKTTRDEPEPAIVITNEGDSYRANIVTAAGQISIGMKRTKDFNWAPMRGPVSGGRGVGYIETALLQVDGNVGGVPDKVIVNGVVFVRPMAS